MSKNKQEAIDQLKDAIDNVDVDELSEEDLEEVSGGWCSWSECSSSANNAEEINAN